MKHISISYISQMDMKQISQWSACRSSNCKYLSPFGNIKNKRRGIDEIKVEEVEVETQSADKPSSPHANSPSDPQYAQSSVGDA